MSANNFLGTEAAEVKVYERGEHGTRHIANLHLNPQYGYWSIQPVVPMAECPQVAFSVFKDAARAAQRLVPYVKPEPVA